MTDLDIIAEQTDPCRRAFSREEMIEEAKAYMRETWGPCRESEDRDRWHERLGMLVDFIHDRFVRCLDLFCCAGGAGEGYRRAGMDVVGVDIRPQPKNPHTFVCADALEFLREFGHEFDFIHASPPCQAYTKAGKQWRKEGREYPDLIAETRRALILSGKPWVIENVPGSPLINPIRLNGSAFGIRVHRPRLFESSFPLPQPDVPPMRPVKMGRPIREGDIVQPVGHFAGVAYAAREMGLPWMGQAELAQAIPPAYTEWIGREFLNTANDGAELRRGAP